MSTTTLTGQQRAVALLAAILATPGLPPATWRVYQDQMATGRAEISGQVEQGSESTVRAATTSYATAFGELTLDDEGRAPGTPDCTAFTVIAASGVIDGVTVRVWGAGR